MKKLIFLFTAIFILSNLNAQTWKMKIHSLTGKHKVKKIKLRPGMYVNIGMLLLDSDTLLESKYYDGSFHGGTHDSIQINLTKVKIYKNFTNGIKQQTTIPANFYFKTHNLDSGLFKIALSDINYLYYRDVKTRIIAGNSSLILGFALMIPMIVNYDYHTHTIRNENTKYLYYGGLMCLLSYDFFNLTYKSKEFQFKTSWPIKSAKVWGFM